MTRRIVPLLAATFLLLTWASAAQASDEPATPSNASVASAAAVQAAPSIKPKPKASKGLCDRVGGVLAIAAVVNCFSDAILVIPALNQNLALVEWNQNEAPTRLPGLKVMRTIWMASMADCPQVKFFGLPLEEAHDRFNLTPAEFGEVGSKIVKALQFYKVAQADIDELVRIYQAAWATWSAVPSRRPSAQSDDPSSRANDMQWAVRRFAAPSVQFA